MRKQAFDFIEDYDEGLALQMAQEAAGNWQDFDSFAWFGEPEDDGGNWTIVYTSNRDSGLLEQSNAKVIEAVMSGFPEDEVRPEHHSHWAVGYVDGYSIRVYNPDGSLTDAFKAWSAIQNAMEQYPILDEEAYSEMEGEAEWENTQEALKDFLYSHENEAFQDFPDSPEKLDELTSSFLQWMNSEGRQTENIDDQGYYPSPEELNQWASEVLVSQMTGVDVEEAPLPPSNASTNPKHAQAQVTEEEYWREVQANAEGAVEVAQQGDDYENDLRDAISEHADSYVVYYSSSFDVLRHTNNLRAAEDIGSFPQDDVLAFITMAAYFAFEQDVYDKLHEMGAFQEPEGMEYEARTWAKGAAGAYSDYWPEVARIAKEIGAMGIDPDQAMEMVESEIDASSWVQNARAAVDTIQLSDNEQAILDAGMAIPPDVESALKTIAYFAMREDILQHSDFMAESY